jgi:hypothetical protein
MASNRYRTIAGSHTIVPGYGKLHTSVSKTATTRNNFDPRGIRRCNPSHNAWARHRLSQLHHLLICLEVGLMVAGYPNW